MVLAVTDDDRFLDADGLVHVAATTSCTKPTIQNIIFFSRSDKQTDDRLYKHIENPLVRIDIQFTDVDRQTDR